MARLAESIASLAGITRFQIAVYPNQSAQQLGLSERVLRVILEASLAAAGLPVAREPIESEPLTAALVAAVGVDRTEDGRRLCVIELDFWQSVVLERAPRTSAFPAITWSVERYASVPAEEAADYAETRLAELAEIFVQDWQTAAASAAERK